MKYLILTLTFTLGFTVTQAREPAAAICRGDAVLAASIIYKMSAPKDYMLDSSTVDNPIVKLIENIDDKAHWSITWKNEAKSIEYKVLAGANETLDNCDIVKVEKTTVR